MPLPPNAHNLLSIMQNQGITDALSLTLKNVESMIHFLPVADLDTPKAQSLIAWREATKAALRLAAQQLDRLTLTDAQAEAAGVVIAADFGLSRSEDEPDRWQTESGSFRAQGIARRAARFLADGIAAHPEPANA